MLVVEPVIEAAAQSAADWLPGSTLTALAQGGTDTVSYGAAVGLGMVYVLGGLALTLTAVTRRDVTD